MNNMEKGKLAENIVKKMFEEAGFKVYKYGYEHLLPELADKNNLLKGMAGQYIRHQPDFVIVNKRNEPAFIEVKFRSDYILQKDVFNYPECYVILLTKYTVLAQKAEYIYEKGWDFCSLNKFHYFESINEKLLEEYSKLVRRKLGDETWLGQTFENFFEKVTRKKFVQPHWFKKIFLKGVTLSKKDEPKVVTRIIKTKPRVITRIKVIKIKPRKKKWKSKGNVKLQKKRWKKRKKIFF